MPELIEGNVLDNDYNLKKRYLNYAEAKFAAIRVFVKVNKAELEGKTLVWFGDDGQGDVYAAVKLLDPKSNDIARAKYREASNTIIDHAFIHEVTKIADKDVVKKRKVLDHPEENPNNQKIVYFKDYKDIENHKFLKPGRKLHRRGI